MQIGCGISPTQPYGVAVPAFTPAFTPASISGLQLWLDASDASTLFTDSAGTTAATADGDPIGCWKDKSGNARNATQTDGTAKPLRLNNAQGNKTGIGFDGINDWLSTASTGITSTGFSYYLVCRYILLDGSDQRMIVGNLIGNAGGFDILTNKYMVYAGVTGFLYIKNASFSTILASIEYNGSNSTFVENNGITYTGDAGTNYPTSIQLAHVHDGGYIKYGKVQQFEFCVFNRILTSSEKSTMQNYLNLKWSIY